MSGFATVQKLILLSLFCTKMTYLFFIASPGGGELSLSSCLAVGKDHQETKKMTNLQGYARGGGGNIWKGINLRWPV